MQIIAAVELRIIPVPHMKMNHRFIKNKETHSHKLASMVLFRHFRRSFIQGNLIMQLGLEGGVEKPKRLISNQSLNDHRSLLLEQQLNNCLSLSTFTIKVNYLTEKNCNGSTKRQKKGSSTFSFPAPTLFNGTSQLSTILFQVAKRPCLRRVGLKSMTSLAKSFIETKRLGIHNRSSLSQRLT